MKYFVGLERMIDILELDLMLSFAGWIELTCDNEYYVGIIPKQILTYGQVLMMDTGDMELCLLPDSGGKIKARLSESGIEIIGKNFSGEIRFYN